MEIYGSLPEKKTHFEKTAFKYMYSNWNLQMHIDKVQLNKHLKVYFGWFLSTSLKPRY